MNDLVAESVLPNRQNRILRIALVCDWFFYYVAALANNLAANPQVRVLVVTRDHGWELGRSDGKKAKQELLDDRVRLNFILGRQRNPVSLWHALSAARAIRSFKPDLVHVQAHHDWRLYLGQRLASRRMILTIHDVQPRSGDILDSNSIQKRVQLNLRRKASAYIVHGRHLCEQLEGDASYNRGAIYSIPHGPLPYPLKKLPLPTTPTILFFGRLEIYKGLDTLVAAADMLEAAIPSLRIIVAGRGPAARVIKSGPAASSLFELREGFIQDSQLPMLFGEASLVVCPYKEASQSGVIPLANQFGRAVIASRVGGLAEAVEDGVTGILIPPDDPNALAEAVCRVLSRPVLLRELSEGAWQRVSNGAGSAAAVANAHLRAYLDLLTQFSSQ